MLGSFAMPISGGPFGQAAEAWNPSKWAAETEYLDAGGASEANPANVDTVTFIKTYWLPMLVIAVAIWLLEKRRISLGGALNARASAGAK